MAGDQLPIVFRTSGPKKALAIVLGLAAVAVGAMMIQKPPTAIAPLAGAVLVIAGLGFTAFAAMSWKRGLPALELNEAGVVYSRTLQGAVRLSWHEIASVDIETTNVPREMGEDIELEAVALHLTDGRTIKLAPIAAAAEMRDAIARALARRNEAHV